MSDVEALDYDECPGCGAKPKSERYPTGCTCTTADMRRLLEKDRAELSDRIAASDMKSNDVLRYARLWKQLAKAQYHRIRIFSEGYEREITELQNRISMLESGDEKNVAEQPK